MPTTRLTTALLLSSLLPLLQTNLRAQQSIHVTDDASLRSALTSARPGTRISIAPGKYRPGLSARQLQATLESPIIIEAADPKNKPIFEGGQAAIHLADCSHLTLRNLIIRGQSANGINIDDAGSFDTPSHHITLEGLEVSDIGPKGNRDAIKLSGIDDLIVRNCTIEGWGGQAIDMVGCHRGLIESCTFRGKTGFSQDSGVQAKGASSDITVRNCTFLDAGQRAVNLGGSTDLKVFRPQGANYEARNITVEGCRFVGSLSPIAFVGVDGATVRYNTLYRPNRWILRILQETTADNFIPCRNGRFERNLIVFQRSQVRTPVNIGAKTSPATFTFKENLWYCEDQPNSSRPDLPTAEIDGVYGLDPKLTLLPSGSPSFPETLQAKSYGASALPEK